MINGLLPCHLTSSRQQVEQNSLRLIRSVRSLPCLDTNHRSMDLLDLIWPGPPGAQAVGDLPVAKSALFVAVNGFLSPSYLRHCPCDGRCFREGVEQRYYHLANFATAMLGLVLVLGQMAFSATEFRSQIVEAVARWLVCLTKVLMVGTLQFGLHVFYFCLKMFYVRSLLVLQNFAALL